MSFEWTESTPRRAHRQQAARGTRALAARAGEACERASEALLARQSAEGFWCGELLADATLESDYVLLQLWLHQPDKRDWNPPSRGRVKKAARSILERQLPDGGFNIYTGGPAEISATVKAYCALKLAGIDPASDPMRRARQRILALGGVQAANSYVKINLSLFGLYPRKHVPSIPPEIVLLPGGVLYEMSSWTRSILVPLSIVQARGGVRHVPPGFTLEEIFLPGASLAFPRRNGFARLFHHLDRLLKVWEKLGPERIRGAAVREAEHWILDRTRFTEGLGAIYPAMMYFIMALDSLGYPADHPDLVDSIRHFESLLLETDTRFTFQPCVPPIWDTAISAFALGEAGFGGHQRMTRAADWLLSKEVRRRGDWSVKRPDIEPSGSPTNSIPISTTPPWCCWPCCTRGVPTRRRRPRPSAAPSSGCSPCSRATAAGPPSTWTTTGRCSTRCPSPTTTPCSTPPARISPGACWSRSAAAA